MTDCFSYIAFIGPGGPEFLVVMLVLLLMFGAKDAPRIFRKLNEMINQLRNTADSFKREVMYGDLNSEPTSDTSAAGDDTYDHDNDFDYDDECCEEEELDYSDETFQSLEDDLEGAGSESAPEPNPNPEATEGEDGDAQKT